MNYPERQHSLAPIMSWIQSSIIIHGNYKPDLIEIQLHSCVYVLSESLFKSESGGRVTVKIARPALSKIFTTSLFTEKLHWPHDLTRHKRTERPRQWWPFWKVRKIAPQGDPQAEERNWRARNMLKNCSGIRELWVWTHICCYFSDNT